MKINDQICEAINIISSKAIENAGYDKTIQGIIEDCIDATIGKYQVRYQDSVFNAVYNGSEILTIGTNVQVLMPANDINKEKIILDYSKQENNQNFPENSLNDDYEIVGNNCIDSIDSEIGLCSYKKEDECILYQYNGIKNLVQLNLNNLNEYLIKSTDLLCELEVQTNLEREHQYNGIYGIIFKICFSDNATGKEVFREYQMDSRSFIGNPYKFFNTVSQKRKFNIDGQNFKRVEEIKIFSKNFVNKDAVEKHPNDIFIRNININGCKNIKPELLKGNNLILHKPNGDFFTKEDNKDKVIKTEFRINNKTVNTNVQKIDYYWFQEDVRINSKSNHYNRYGGIGWRCLNEHNEITITDENNKNDKIIYEFLPGPEEFVFKKEQIYSKEQKYKCVAVYKNQLFEKEFIIKNYDAKYEFKIISDSGQEFYNDIGSPSLTCLVNELEDNKYKYVWTVKNKNDYLSILEETTELNNKYNNLIEKKNDLENSFNPNSDAATLKKVKQDILDLRQNTRVDANKIYDIKINTIDLFSTYKCSVYGENDIYLGSAELILYNKRKTESGYTLILKNGTQVFNYNEQGILDKDQIVKPLEFIIYNNLGQELPKEVYSECEIEWKIPSKNSMIKTPQIPEGEKKVDLINNFTIWTSQQHISVFPQSRYNINNNRNTIYLTVKYKDIILYAQTNFSFVKQGDNGTNGTDIYCKIVPNIDEDFSQIPYLTKSGNNVFLNFNPKIPNAWFKVQLWENGECIFNSATSGSTINGDSAAVVWSILKNKYTSQISDESNLSIDGINNFKYISNKDINRDEPDKVIPANIIKACVSYEDINYYATLPLITVELKNSDYRISLKENSGFQYVNYSADGRRPQYPNNAPFEILLEEKNGEFYEDRSSQGDYTWKILGKVKNNLQQNLLENTRLEKKNNQYWIKPIDTFDGQCVNNAIQCVVKKNNILIGTIHIPIHMFINKFGHAALNDWDGNSIQLNEEGGSILSPQVGAGKKDSNNSFTGILMGEVQEANASKKDIGLMGYHQGQRSIFLDSETGKAVFGKSRSGQIVIDPSQVDPVTHKSVAKIYSGDYYNDNGRPKGTGLLIDLSEPEIRYGSGNFVVDSSGYITAKGGGSIAGWNIDNDSLFTDRKDNPSNVRISAKDFTRDVNSVSRNNLRIALGRKFAVSADGTMYAGDAIIGTGSDKITIGKSDAQKSALFSGGKSSFTADRKGFYLGTDGIALGNNFSVNNNGQLIAKSGYIGNGSSGWKIQPTSLVSGKIVNGIYECKSTYNDLEHEGVYLGAEGIGLGSNFYVSRKGSLTANDGNIAGWKITANRFENDNANIYIGTGGIRITDNFSVNGKTGKMSAIDGDFAGKITSSSGTIGGWTIDASSLKAGDITISSNGSISSGSNWSINADGSAHFQNAQIDGTSTIAGNTVTSGGGGVPWNSLNADVESKVIDLADKEIQAAKISTNQLTVAGTDADWSIMYSVTSVTSSSGLTISCEARKCLSKPVPEGGKSYTISIATQSELNDLSDSLSKRILSLSNRIAALETKK